jgi:hypothetical protein
VEGSVLMKWGAKRPNTKRPNAKQTAERTDRLKGVPAFEV